MKKLLFILLCFFAISAKGQLVSFILRGDTLFAINPSTGEERQLTKFLPTVSGQNGKVLSSNGNGWEFTTATGIPADSSADINNRIVANLQRLLDSLSNHITKVDGKQPAGNYLTSYSETDPLSWHTADTSGKKWDWGDITGPPAFITNIPTDSSLSINNKINGKQSAITTGTTAQYFKGDLSLGTYIGHTINVQALTSSPADAQTVYFGMLPKAPTTTANISKVYVRQAGTITAAEIYCYSGTAGTSESWSLYIRVNNTTDYLIATVAAATSERVFTNSSLSISLAAGDYFEIKGVQPTFATNPLTTIYGGYIKIN